MTDLVFSVKNIFQLKGPEDCLVQYDSERFNIPAYQRGFKWSSSDGGAVTKLLKDLSRAYNRKDNKDYYLQYITVKQDKQQRHLEVIDGQQRLTTLTIMLSIISLLTEA